jgi:hypothetical protein
VERLEAAGLSFTGQKKQRGTTFAGKTFVLTGTLERATRDEAKKLIEDAGGKVVGIGQQEDGLRCRRRRGRIETGQGDRALTELLPGVFRAEHDKQWRTPYHEYPGAVAGYSWYDN